jgi:hypothetical protein
MAGTPEFATTMDCALAREISAGKPCRGSLMPTENSLFRRISSLFRLKFSLFGCVGNSVQKPNE